jgi:rRNA maturation RNase YbeY
LLDDFELQNPESFKVWLKNVIRNEQKYVGDIVYIFSDDEYLHAINLDFLNHDTLTDIITFDTSEDSDVISGEIYISVERVADNAGILNKDFQEELSRVLVHGVLHLIGYGDKTPEEKTEMTAKEDYYLNLQP